MRLARALKAAWRAFVAEWKNEQVAPARPALPVSPEPVRYQVIRKIDGRDVLVYNEFNGGEAGRLMCAEKNAGNVAEFWMQTPNEWIMRDWSPR